MVLCVGGFFEIYKTLETLKNLEIIDTFESL